MLLFEIQQRKRKRPSIYRKRAQGHVSVRRWSGSGPNYMVASIYIAGRTFCVALMLRNMKKKLLFVPCSLFPVRIYTMNSTFYCYSRARFLERLKLRVDLCRYVIFAICVFCLRVLWMRMMANLLLCPSLQTSSTSKKIFILNSKQGTDGLVWVFQGWALCTSTVVLFGEEIKKKTGAI